jgi:hypothetical protein
MNSSVGSAKILNESLSPENSYNTDEGRSVKQESTFWKKLFAACVRPYEDYSGPFIGH